MTIFDVASSIATVGALLAAIWQLRRQVADGRRRDQDRRVERAIELYEAVVAEGQTHEAFHRLSLLLRRIGSEKYGKTTWKILSDKDIEAGGELDPRNTNREQAYADLYAILWFFERCKMSLRREIVSEDILMETLGFHFWWWGELLRDLKGPKSVHAVHDLAERSRMWASREGLIQDWIVRCADDFNGSGAIGH